jgi:uroporphyrinogen decarboxylase
LNNRELVLKCLRHEHVEKLPVDFYQGWMWPGITSRIMEKLNAGDFDELLNRMDISCRWLTPLYKGPELPTGVKNRVTGPHTANLLNPYIWGMKAGIKEHGQNTGGHPLAEAETEEDIFKFSWPSPEWFDYDGLYENTKKYKDQFVIAGGFSPIFYMISDLCGMEKTLMDMVLNPELTSALVYKISEFYKGYFTRIAEKCRGVVDAIAFGDDFASQSGLMMSPELWRKFFKPAWAELFSIAKENGYKVMFHSCGSVFKVIPDLIEAGLDVLYPVQPKAASMDLITLKDRFGSLLSFYGGVDVQELMPFGKPEEIKNEVERLDGLFKKNGGYIMATSHVIMEQVPIENVFALYGQVKDSYI